MSAKETKASGSSTASLKQKIAKEEPQALLNQEELEQKLAEAEKKAEENWERVLRMQADMDNAERRSKLSIEQAHKFALQKFALELLPVIDNLERAIASHASEDDSAGSLLDGVELTLKMFKATLEKFGIVEVNPIDQGFNPELHQAVSTLEDAGIQPGNVVSVLQKGYILNSRLIRPALVVVAK